MASGVTETSASGIFSVVLVATSHRTRNIRTPLEHHHSLPSTSPSAIATRPNLRPITAFYYAITPRNSIASALWHRNAHPRLRVDKKNGTSSIEAQAAREPISVQCGSCRKACGLQGFTSCVANGRAGKLA